MAASLDSLYAHFRAYFSMPHVDPLPGVARAAVARAKPMPFTRDDVLEGLGRMAHNKTCGLGTYSVDLLRGMRDEGLYDAVAALFTFFASVKYPRMLNRLLLLPLYKGKGSRKAAVNYRPISLIHPLGRWYAVCLTARLEKSTLQHRAFC